jgi:hypothetical protein
LENIEISLGTTQKNRNSFAIAPWAEEATPQGAWVALDASNSCILSSFNFFVFSSRAPSAEEALTLLNIVRRKGIEAIS